MPLLSKCSAITPELSLIAEDWAPVRPITLACSSQTSAASYTGSLMRDREQEEQETTEVPDPDPSFWRSTQPRGTLKWGSPTKLREEALDCGATRFINFKSGKTEQALLPLGKTALTGTRNSFIKGLRSPQKIAQCHPVTRKALEEGDEAPLQESLEQEKWF